MSRDRWYYEHSRRSASVREYPDGRNC
jgi:hypothetical protein